MIEKERRKELERLKSRSGEHSVHRQCKGISDKFVCGFLFFARFSLLVFSVCFFSLFFLFGFCHEDNNKRKCRQQKNITITISDITNGYKEKEKEKRQWQRPTKASPERQKTELWKNQMKMVKVRVCWVLWFRSFSSTERALLSPFSFYVFLFSSCFSYVFIFFSFIHRRNICENRNESKNCKRKVKTGKKENYLRRLHSLVQHSTKMTR